DAVQERLSWLTPAVATVRFEGAVGGWVSLKVAVTVFAASTVTVQLATPLQSVPLQPVKAEPLSATDVRVTLLPAGKGEEQVVPQLIPGRSLVTLPCPFPGFLMSRVASASSCGRFCVA